jgi:hypothetical protein
MIYEEFEAIPNRLNAGAFVKLKCSLVSRCMLSCVRLPLTGAFHMHGICSDAGCFIHELLLARDVTRVQLSLSISFMYIS